MRPENVTGVFLNERLVLHFSEPLDPTSVHGRSVLLAAADGRAARGRLEVFDRRLEFQPDPVLSPELDDGGYLPGTRYTLELAGFPRPEALRGRSGAPLWQSVSWSFETVTALEPRSDFVFEDSSLDHARPLILRSNAVASGDPIVLEGEEPIDPSSLGPHSFHLERLEYDKQGPGTRPPRGEPIALHPVLVDNRDKRAPRPRGTTLLELWPERLLQQGSYLLRPRGDVRDFGGNLVAVLDPRFTRLLEVEVRERGAGPPSSTFTEHFFDARMRSPEAVEGADGTAWWGDSGRAEVRWPAAAGSGADGAAFLEGAEARRDLQATRLEVKAGRRCELLGGPGLVVLRAQGSLRIDGELVRRGPEGRFSFGRPPPARSLWPGWPGSPGPAAAVEWGLRAPPRLAAVGAGGLGGPEPLSSWLERARAAGVNGTVLIAGGDLVVRGRIQVDGPLLFAAGGRIRVAGREHVSVSEPIPGGELSLYALGEGASWLALPAPLALDPPLENPLVEPLAFAVLSGPIPPQGSAARWHPAPEVGGYAGSHGSFRVRYVGEGEGRLGGDETLIVKDDPVLLGETPVLRLLVELEVRPGGRWDPPWVDFVQLSWEQDGRRR